MKQKKSWYKRWWAIALFIFIGLIILGGIVGEDPSSSENSDSSATTSQDSSSSSENAISPITITEEDSQETIPTDTSKSITASDTGETLLVLDGSEIVDGDCSTAKPFSEYGVSLPENCKGVWSTNVANYCELGNRVGENTNYYYCRPERFIDCNIVSSSGEIKDINRYGITKVLQCDGENEQLIDVIVRT